MWIRSGKLPHIKKSLRKRERRQRKHFQSLFVQITSWLFDKNVLLLHRLPKRKLGGACLFGLAENIPIDLIRVMPS